MNGEMEGMDKKQEQGDSGEACRRYEARLEGILEHAPDAELAQHLSQCAGCSAAFSRAQLAGNWLRAARQPAAEADERMVSRVMARIRSEQEVRSSAGAFWVPVQLLASRVALVAGMALLGLSLYVYKSAPRVADQPQGGRVEATAEFPQPPAQPADKDEVLASLSDSQYGH